MYRGWLTRGLSSWSINKVILGDSFGESYSLCKHLNLESGKPQRLTLSSGDCHEEELLLKAEKLTKEAQTKSAPTTSLPQSSTEIYPTFNVTSDVMSLGKHIPLERNETESVKSTTAKAATKTTEIALSMISNVSWKPMLSSSTPGKVNKTKPAANDSSEIDDETFLNTGEQMPKARTEKRSFGESGEDDLMNSVPIREDSSDMEAPADDDDRDLMDENSENKFVTVQLFQYRLGDVFQKAEKYARFTLFPLLSEQISNIFNFETTEKDGRSTDSPIVIKSKTKNLRKYDFEEEIDVRSLQSMGLKISDNLKPIEKLFNNYGAKKDEKSDKENVRIDLPTYRPPESEKLFIPIERHP